ncbi:MAG: hypothetical protein AAF182_01040 [Pseudomonadota bacterium]
MSAASANAQSHSLASHYRIHYEDKIFQPLAEVGVVHNLTNHSYALNTRAVARLRFLSLFDDRLGLRFDPTIGMRYDFDNGERDPYARLGFSASLRLSDHFSVVANTQVPDSDLRSVGLNVVFPLGSLGKKAKGSPSPFKHRWQNNYRYSPD